MNVKLAAWVVFGLTSGQAQALGCPPVEVNEALVEASGLGDLYTGNVELMLQAKGDPARDCKITLSLDGPFLGVVYAALDATWTDDPELMLLHSATGFVGRDSISSVTSWDVVTAAYFDMIEWLESLPAPLAGLTTQMTFQTEALAKDVASGRPIAYSDLHNPNFRAGDYVRKAKLAYSPSER